MEAITNIIMNIRVMDVVDILIVAFVFHKLLMLIRETRAEQLVKGLITLLVILKFSEWAKLYVVHFILKNTMTIGVVALLIVFQPELRRALEYIGRNKFLSKSIADMMEEEAQATAEEIVNAVTALSKERIGALIVMERETGLNEVIETGVRIDGQISAALLDNIFIPNTPLHDGAVIIRKERIMAAGCFLPLTDNQSLNKELGTRHRAAIGIAEQSDAIAIVVSEETGAISIAMAGKLQRFLDANTLRSILKKAYKREERPLFMIRKWGIKHDSASTNREV